MRGITPEDYGLLERVSSLVGSPDGDCAYVVYGWRKTEYRRRVECLRPGRRPEPVTAGGNQETAPAFSPDGRALFFLSDGRLCALNRGDGAVRVVYEDTEGFQACGYAVLANGVAVSVRREIREAVPEGCDWERPLVAEELHYRNDADHGFTKKYEYRLMLLQEGGEPKLLAEGAKDWSGLTAAGRNQLLYRQGFWKLMDTETGEIRDLDGENPAGGVAAASPDGRTVLAAVRCGDQMDLRLACYTVEKEIVREEITEGFDWPGDEGAYCDRSTEYSSQISFRPDGSALLIATSQGIPGLMTVRAGDAAKGKAPAAPGTAGAQEAAGRSDARGVTGVPRASGMPGIPGLVLECAAAGNQIWMLQGSDITAPEVCRWEDGEMKDRTEHNPWLKERTLQPWRPVEAPSPDGKALLKGWCVLPECDGQGETEETGRIPVLLWIHGGPEGFFAPGLYLEIQAAVSRGFAVVMPNPRGSSGYGSAYQHSGQEFDQGACYDVLTLLDGALRAFPALDGGRIGVLGGSYGGYMSAMLAGTTKRFRAAAVIKPVTNWLFIHFKSSQSGQNVFASHRDFQDFMTETLRMSPVIHAGEVEIPTLIIHGEKDQQCPPENAHQFYVAVRDTHPDLPVRLVCLPDCCHAYSRDALTDYLTVQRETLEWMERYV